MQPVLGPCQANRTMLTRLWLCWWDWCYLQSEGLSWGTGVVEKVLQEGTLHCLSEPSDGIMQQNKEIFTEGEA